MNKTVLLLIFFIPSVIFADNYLSIKLNKGTFTKSYKYEDELGNDIGVNLDFDTIGLVFDFTPVKKFGVWGNLGFNYILSSFYLGTDHSGSKTTPDSDFNYTSDFNLGICYTTKSKVYKLQYCLGSHMNWINIDDSKSLTAGVGGQFSFIFPIKDVTWINISLITNYDFYEIYENEEQSMDFIASFISALQIGISL